MKIATAGVVVAGVIVLAALTLPILGRGTASPLVFALVAFRSLTLLVAAIAVALIAISLLVMSGRRAAAIVAVLTALLVLPFLITLGGGTASDVPAAHSEDELRILSWNTDQRDVDDDLMVLVEQTRPDIIVLPEYFTSTAEGRFATFAEANEMSVYGWDGSSATILIADRLGKYTMHNGDTPPWAGIYLVPERHDAPFLTVAHLQRPMLTEGADLWRQHVAWVRDRCDRGDAIAVGDFNATLANLGSDRLGSCSEVAATLGQPESGTWPALLPAQLGAQIDHVFAGDDWLPTWFGVLDAPGTRWSESSDHRPIFVILDRN